jgi:CO/xanthine dehydrogenase Mo-binding subunit
VSQFRGGIIMGIGMALTEETVFDDRNGRIVNATLAEYHIPVQAAVPHIDIVYTDIPDPHTPLGAHGIGVKLVLPAPPRSPTRCITRQACASAACPSL